MGGLGWGRLQGRPAARYQNTKINAKTNQGDSRGPRISRYHCKAVDGVFEGTVFAGLQLYIFLTAGWTTCANQGAIDAARHEGVP